MAHVCPREPDEDGVDAFANSTMLLSRLQDLEALAKQVSTGRAQLESAMVVTPGHINGTASWKMERLVAVWDAKEPDTSSEVEETVVIYETQAGALYFWSLFRTPIEQLVQRTVRCRFPAAV